MICGLLLKHFYGLTPEKHRLETNEDANACQTDAFVIIGDRALAYQPSDCWTYRYDIGELWKSQTGLPLVFAAWIGNSSKVWEPPVVSALELSRDKGLQHFEEILDIKERKGVALPMSREQTLDYYRHAVVYTLGEEEQAGLQRFREIAEMCSEP